MSQSQGGPAAGEPFIGRSDALAMLHAVLDEALAGRPGCVLIEGAPGMGKTTLIRRFVGERSDARGVVASGDESETLVDYAVADQLLRIAGIARPGALGAPDLASVGVALLEAFGTGPLVVVVDDAHWADAASLRALLFALRRLSVEAVLAVIAVRDGMTGRIPEGLLKLADGRHLKLVGLTGSEVADLGAAVGAALSLRGASRLGEHTLGNPLYVRTLLADVSASAWEDREYLPPAPEAFSRTTRQRLAELTPSARALVEAAAVLGVRSSLGTAAAVAGLREPLEALEEAEGRRLIGFHARDGTIAFAHPLLRAAIYHGLGAALRARLHAEAARLVVHPGVVLRHRAAAANVPDPGLSAELASFGGGEARRGAWESAAAAFTEAGRLSDGDAEEFELQAIDALLFAGHVSAARARLADASDAAPGPLRACVLAHEAIIDGRMLDAEQLLADAWQQVDVDADPQVALGIARRSAYHWLARLRGAEAVEWSRRAIALAGEDAMTAWPLGMALAFMGEHGEARAVLDRALADAPSESGLPVHAMRGWLCLLDDDVSGALADLRAAGPAALRLGSDAMAVVAFTWLAQAELASGDWDAAARDADRALSIALAGNESRGTANAHGAVIEIALVRGDAASAGEHARAITGGANSAGATVASALAQARIAAAGGDPQRVLEVLVPLVSAAPRGALDEPGLFPWPELQAEALVRLERIGDADEFLRLHEALAAERGRRSAIMRLARIRGRLEAARGRREDAERAFACALALAGELEMPYELALSRLARAQFLRRLQRRREAVALLEAAQETFVALGAAPALERCERELVASGREPAKRADPDRSRLTPREHAVAQLAVSGLTNREIAAELMLSIKTVEVHLSRVFGKLDVASRGELRGRLERHP